VLPLGLSKLVRAAASSTEKLAVSTPDGGTAQPDPAAAVAAR
jgi:hypothetical protein